MLEIHQIMNYQSNTDQGKFHFDRKHDAQTANTKKLQHYIMNNKITKNKKVVIYINL